MVCRYACEFGVIIDLIFVTSFDFELGCFWCLGIIVAAC